MRATAVASPSDLLGTSSLRCGDGRGPKPPCHHNASLSQPAAPQIDGLSGLTQLLMLDVSHNQLAQLDAGALPPSLRFMKVRHRTQSPHGDLRHAHPLPSHNSWTSILYGQMTTQEDSAVSLRLADHTGELRLIAYRSHQNSRPRRRGR